MDRTNVHSVLEFYKIEQSLQLSRILVENHAIY